MMEVPITMNPYKVHGACGWGVKNCNLSKEEAANVNSSIPQVVLKMIGLAKDLFHATRRRIYAVVERNIDRSVIIGEKDKPLVVLIHGLDSDPAQMRPQRQAIEKTHGAAVAIFQPRVEKRGNCSLDEAAQKIHETILEWVKENPDTPIIFSGVSNGARISAHVAYKLKVESQIKNAIKVHAIVGPFLGTRKLNQPGWRPCFQRAWRRLVNIRYRKIVIDELSWKSQQSKEVINEVRQAANNGVKFTFYSTTADSLVIPHNSSLPLEKGGKKLKGAKYHIFHTEGHSSVSNNEYVKEKVCGSINKFLNIGKK